jgi:predicted MFS family arabinose efflux permease
VRALPPRLWPSVGAFTLFALGNASDLFFLLLLSRRGFSPTELALVWATFHVGKYAASTPGGVLADRVGPRAPVLAGWAMYAACYALFPIAHAAWAMLTIMGIYAIYYGLTEGPERLLVSRFTSGDDAGTLMGAYHLVTGTAGVAASALFGLIYTAVSPTAAFATGATLAAGATALLCTVRIDGRSR